MLPEVQVSQRAADRVAAGHPWIYSTELVSRPALAPGAAVRVNGPHRELLGTAHYSSSSQIALRLLSKRAETVDAAFFRDRLERAAAYRRAVVQDSTAYRLAHAEGDFLPALVIDRYGDYFALQTLDQGMDAAKPDITAALVDLFHPAGVVERNDAAVRRREGLAESVATLHGEVPPEVEFEMHGLRLAARLAAGQKTGVFLDQRENYAAARRFAHAPVLDCFTYAGGFALHLAAAAGPVEAVDSSAEALELGRANARRNGLSGQVEFRKADVFDLLPQYDTARRRFGTVVLDPPAFAKSRSHVEAASRAYKEINRRALRLLDRGGVLITCSCSHHLSEADFLQAIAAASLEAGRDLRVLERRTQALDHPILLTVPQTHYLKCLVFQVV